MAPKKSSALKRDRSENPTGLPPLTKTKRLKPSSSNSSEGIHAQSSGAGHMSRPVVDPEKVTSAFLIYVVLNTSRRKSATTITRKVFESQAAAVDAFRLEYATWTVGGESGLYPPNHTDKQLSAPYLVNLLEISKKQDTNPGRKLWQGRGRVRYEITHRDDRNLGDDTQGRRRCMIICEEVAYQKT